MDLNQTTSKALHIMELADEINEKKQQDWIKQDIDWDSAIYVKIANTIDSCLDTWWNSVSELNINKLKLNLIDVSFFIISKLIQTPLQNQYQSKSIASIWERVNKTPSNIKPGEYLTILKKIPNSHSSIALKYIFEILHSLGSGIDELYSVFMSRNIMVSFLGADVDIKDSVTGESKPHHEYQIVKTIFNQMEEHDMPFEEVKKKVLGMIGKFGPAYT